MQYLRRANGAERFVLSLHELRQHERVRLKGPGVSDLPFIQEEVIRRLGH
jgi:hypothetical protein